MSLHQKAWVFNTYVIGVFIIAVLPLNSGSNNTLTNNMVVNIRLDHLLHAILFIPWAYLGKYFRDFKFFKLCIYGLLLGISTEAIQIITPYRTFNINDMIANMFGTIFGLILLFVPVKVIFPTSVNKKCH